VSWNSKEITSRPAVTEPHSVEVNGLMWIAIHGNLQLALRHPHNTGPSRTLVLAFVLELGDRLVEWGVLTAEELQLSRLMEQVESPHHHGL